MTAEEIMTLIDAKRTRQRELTKATWYAPAHIAVAAEPELETLHEEIEALKVQLFRIYVGKVRE